MKKSPTLLGLYFVLFLYNSVHGSSANSGVRFRRLTKPAMYWGPWSDWSSCSSQCGEGVETKTRQCLQWTPGSEVVPGLPWQCQGYGEKKRLCYGKCEEGPTPPSTDECSGLNFNYKGVRGLSREWVEVKRGFPCEVVCRSTFNRGTRTIRVKKNGTPCQAYDVSNGECFSGLCKSVYDGCRDSYGRPLQIDMCMECGGTNSTCERVEGTFRTSRANNDLNDVPVVVRIPEGSTSINIVKHGGVMNTLALLDSSNNVVINERRWPSKEGNYKIDGILWVYSQGMNQESMTSQGPTVANITVRLNTRFARQEVHYSLWIPNGRSLGPENYFNSNSARDFQLGNWPQVSNERDFIEPFLLQTTPKPQDSREFYESETTHRPMHSNGYHDKFENVREPEDIGEFEKPAQIQLKPHPSQTRDIVDNPFTPHKESGPSLNEFGAKTLVIPSGNKPDITLEDPDESSNQIEREKGTTFLAPSSSDNRNTSPRVDNDVWKFVETELKNRGEEYIWDLVEQQLNALWEEAIWEQMEEELLRLGDEYVWELVEEGLRRFHKSSQNRTPQNTDIMLGPALESNSHENIPRVRINPGTEGDLVIDGGEDIDIVTDTEEDVKFGHRSKDTRTQRVNITFRELPPRDDGSPRVRPKGKIRKLRKPKSKRPKRKRTKQKKKGKWRQNDIYRYLKPNEHCFPCIRPKDKVRQFCTSDFVSKVHVNRRKVIGNETRYDVTVLSSYRNRVSLLQREYIWMESTCRCPRVKTKRTYIMMGTMQSLSDRQSRLVITPKSYIRGFSVGFDRKIRELAADIQCPE